MIDKSMDAGSMTVVAVHGIQGTSASWKSVAEACAAQASFICPNLRGRADALRGQGPGDYRLSRFSQDLLNITRNRLDDRPFILAGWSMGVSVALEYLQHNDRPQPCGLILLSGSPRPGVASWFRQQGDELLVEIAEREKRLNLAMAADHQAVAWTWEELQQVDHTASLESIRLPTLIIHGDADPDSPLEHARWLSEGIRDAELRIIAGAGHSLLTENTAVVAQYINAFITKLYHAQERP
ncbi:alpha/beta fold hydrolase [Pseudomonas saudiphocaensis]|uniref:Alpha/beta hydrolase fold family protein n=1 Tax=Pseudomonas saudiphocaensis TaxID=1499686 RepID=A0A078LT31_9PSED|nr:alpha/beta hydrolase [Pseudomonas saudiphocaensis]CDZ93492.1 alpha/beta hydrolase fold family protein [Pseudomonas saudiphocaensis]